eukprot:TRINITY_DN30887_c0_g1_i1.p1 TRINITY_DN30887_c0_g1~~TRINITY_DN30887_c0_g1_i1.p1  ORF type:complete len:286 (+),score=85.04 TRINITY_DN30887_c0_g1_i1:72-860(+)
MQPASAAGQPGAAVAQVRFPLPSGEELVIAEAVGARAEAADSRDRTGRGVWAGSWALATLLHRPGPAAAAPQARDKVVVELGSGCALAGLAAAAAGAREAWLTDHCEAALVTAAHNAAVNSGLLAGCSVRTAVLDWDAPCVAEEGGPPQCDLVLGADVLYSGMSEVPDLFASSAGCRSYENGANVARAVAALLRPAPAASEAWIVAERRRSPEQVAAFIQACQDDGLHVADLGRPPCAGATGAYVQEVDLAALCLLRVSRTP